MIKIQAIESDGAARYQFIPDKDFDKIQVYYKTKENNEYVQSVGTIYYEYGNKANKDEKAIFYLDISGGGRVLSENVVEIKIEGSNGNIHIQKEFEVLSPEE